MNYTAVCTLHGKVLSTQQSKSKTVARQLASRHAVERLNNEPELLKLCDCASVFSGATGGLDDLRDALPGVDEEDGDDGAPAPVAEGRISPAAIKSERSTESPGAHAIVGAGAAPAVKLSSKARKQRGMKVESEEDGEFV